MNRSPRIVVVAGAASGVGKTTITLGLLEAYRRRGLTVEADADLAVVEGVMGCFDGRDGISDDGSTAPVAKWLGAPVVLVVDASASARSVAAVVLGFERFDADLSVAAVIANRVVGEAHARWGIMRWLEEHA